MQTLTTHQLIGLTSTTYTVHAEDGQTIGTYHQDHGADVVASPDLPAEDNGVVGPLEAIATFARTAGIKGWTLSENVTTACSSELTEDIGRRADALGARAVHVGDIARWAAQMGLSPAQLVPAVMNRGAVSA